MKKILYIIIKEVPYRTKFFNLLNKKSNLTVIYQNEDPTNRNKHWAKSIKKEFNYKFLGSNLSIFKQVVMLLREINKGNYDEIIFGCCNDKAQIFVFSLLKILRKKFILNLDGEMFFDNKGIKNKIKKIIISGADKYLVTGEEASNNLKKIIKSNQIYPYHFSSLTNKELLENQSKKMLREDYVLVIGQYYDYKGLDVVLEVAKKLNNINFKFTGLGYKTNEFKKLVDSMNLKNVKINSFLSDSDLEKEYLKCKLLCLPSRQECWGLVINEAASYGTPIVSTTGAGAAIEFLNKKYNCYLARPNDVDDLANKIRDFFSKSKKEVENYSIYLKRMSEEYSLEKSVDDYMKCIEGGKR